MNPTHAELEYKWLTEMDKCVTRKQINSCLIKAMKEAAHATEKAGEVEEDTRGRKFSMIWNSARAQSRRQLDAHFGRTKNGVEF